MFSLQGKTAFITGAAGGIGRAVAERFIEAGAEVVVTDVVDSRAIAEDMGAHFLLADVSDEKSISDSLKQAKKILGPLDIVINNAGIGDVGYTLEETSESLMERIIRINQMGVFYGLKHAPDLMNEGGSIINTSSLAAIVKMVGSGAYSATKAAVVSMTRMAALELGSRGIRVNAICPGYIDTAMGGEDGMVLSQQLTALGRAGTTDDLVGVFHFLAANESKYITGQAIVVDGGWSCGPTSQLLETILGSSKVR